MILELQNNFQNFAKFENSISNHKSLNYNTPNDYSNSERNEYLKFKIDNKPKLYQEIWSGKPTPFSSFCQESKDLEKSEKYWRIPNYKSTMSARNNKYIPLTWARSETQVRVLGQKESKFLDISEEVNSSRSPYVGISTRSKIRPRFSQETVSESMDEKPKIFSIEMLEKAVNDVKSGQDTNFSYSHQLSENQDFIENLKIPTTKESRENTSKDIDSSLLWENSVLVKELDFLQQDFPTSLKVEIQDW